MLKETKTKITAAVSLIVIILSVVFIVDDSNFSNELDESQSKLEKQVFNRLPHGYRESAAYWHAKRENAEGEIPTDLVYAAKQAATKSSSYRSGNLNWTELGPDNVGGRCRGLIIDNEDFNLMFAGSVSGGLWYSNTGGTSWMKTSPGDLEENLNVSSICQDKDGYIYYGTGEGFYKTGGNDFAGNGGGGFIGSGVWRSDQPHGTTFSKRSSTWGSSSTIQTTWREVNAMATDPNTGRVYAATGRGIKYSDDKGTTWIDAIQGGLGAQIAWDVKVAVDGSVLVAIAGRSYRSTTGDQGTFSAVSGVTAGTLPSSGLGRIRFAFAPSDPNYAYACIANSVGVLKAVYKSTDNGETWSQIVAGGSEAFKPFGPNQQGVFDMAFSVHPTNKDKLYLGGVDMYSWELNQGWKRLTNWFAKNFSPQYVHADKHDFVFHPTNPDKMFIACDGGIFKSVDGGETYTSSFKNFNVTQMYGMGFSSTGEVLGGTQDNSTPYIDYNGSTTQAADVQIGGDGGYAEISYLDPNVFIGETPNAAVKRSSNKGDAYSDFLSHPDIPSSGSISTFIAPFLLWESDTDTLAHDSVKFIASENYLAGDTIKGFSNVSSDFEVTTVLSSSLSNGDSMMIADPYQSKFIIGLNSGIYMTRELHDFSATPEWIHLTDQGSTVLAIAISNDGDIIYYGDSQGRVYRISNVSAVLTQEDGEGVTSKVTVQQIDALSNDINSITVDPNDNGRILVTMAGYGYNDYVFYSDSADVSSSTSNTLWSIQGNLPDMPVYSCLIDYSDPNMFLVGTENGIYASSNMGASWFIEDNGFPHVVTVAIRQQLHPKAENFKEIFVATHGRGMFKTASLVSIGEPEGNSIGAEIINLTAYPNPVGSENLSIEVDGIDGQISYHIFDLTGQLIERSSAFSANEKLTVDVSNLATGQYLIRLQGDNNFVGISKFIRFKD